MNKNTLVNAIKSADVHKKTGTYIRDILKPGLTLKEIAILIENNIKKELLFDINNPLDKGIGFPVGLSLNNCAAHYTPNYYEPDIILKEDDILKIDYGVHIGGTIIDSAFTVHFNSKYDEFINISKNITKYAVSLCGPDAILGEIGADIEEYIKSKEIIIDNKTYDLKVMGDLTGHLISKYEIHAGKAVPNVKIFYPLRMNPNEYYAIEPFITTGDGKSILKAHNSHFMLLKDHDNIYNSCKNISKNEKKIYNLLKINYGTLPFCQRWLYELNKDLDYDNLLKEFENKKILKSYPPIYDIDNSIISQFEHTIFIKDNGIINLTSNNFY
jgi:methionyl aminopeptidase